MPNDHLWMSWEILYFVIDDSHVVMAWKWQTTLSLVCLDLFTYIGAEKAKDLLSEITILRIACLMWYTLPGKKNVWLSVSYVLSPLLGLLVLQFHLSLNSPFPYVTLFCYSFYVKMVPESNSVADLILWLAYDLTYNTLVALWEVKIKEVINSLTDQFHEILELHSKFPLIRICSWRDASALFRPEN